MSIDVADLAVIDHALAAVGSPEAQRCLATLRTHLHGATVLDTDELVSAWADGASVQVRAVTIYGDPVDMSSAEARTHARQILAAADEADSG